MASYQHVPATEQVYKSVVSTRLSHQSLTVDSTTNNYSNIMQVLNYYHFFLLALRSSNYNLWLFSRLYTGPTHPCFPCCIGCFYIRRGTAQIHSRHCRQAIRATGKYLTADCVQ